MVQDQPKFPFKYFLSVIEALEKEDALSSWQIAKAIDSCISDASEVTRMLHYLTDHGKITSNPEKGNWRIIRKKEDSDPPSKNFRVKYIQKHITLLEVLTDEPQSVEALANKTSFELDDIIEALSFLTSISEKGHIHLQGSGYQQQWSFRLWPPSFS